MVIARSMCVFGNNESTVRFGPSTLDNPFVEVFNQIYARIKCAHAAKIYQEKQCIAVDTEQSIDENAKTDSHEEISKKRN
ncbi:hypothetical protein V4B17_04105 [Bartonella sp. B23]